MAGVKKQPARTAAPKPYKFVVAGVRPLLQGITRRDWHGGENLPASGGFIVAANHVSEIDPFTVAHFLVDHGCPPMFLAKSSLFEIPVAGKALSHLGQVPVYRGTRKAANSLAAAEEAIRTGHCVVIMPEGTLTRDPGLWPMKAHTGVGRLALRTGAPVIPIGQWGAHELLAPYARRPTNLLKRPVIHVSAGPAVDLSDLAGQAHRSSAISTATGRIMAGVTAQVARFRSEEPPSAPFDRFAQDSTNNDATESND